MMKIETSGIAIAMAWTLGAVVGCGTNDANEPTLTPDSGVSKTSPALDSGGPETSPAVDSAGPETSPPQPEPDAGSGSACNPSPPSAPAGGVAFAIDLAKGPARQFHPPAAPVLIPDYVYGINGFGFVSQNTRWGLIRQGGDAYTDWNWTVNYENAGADYCYWEGQSNGGSALAGAIAVPTSGADSIPAAQAKGEAYLATAPILEHVSAKFDNNTGINNLCPGAAACNGSTASVAINSGKLDFVSVDPNSPAFVANAAAKGAPFCQCAPGAGCAGGCAVSTNPVYQDEFANYLKTAFGGGGAPVFIMLDNEPNYWGSTHPEMWPYTGTIPCETANVSFDDIVTRNKTFATAIKAAWPETKVFGPVVAQDGLIYAHGYTDPHLPTEFLDYYLTQMAAAAATAGQPLIDVLDVHYYNTSTDPSQCVQNPRMFWDPNYTSLSAADTDKIDFGWSGQNSYFDTHWYPRQVIPRILGKIASAYPAGGPGLSFSEYNSGCETVIAGAVAEADNLGIFGREGAYAATAWPLQSLTNNYLVAAYDLYRNYDGNGAIVGDTAVNATTTDATDTSVYAFAHSGDASAVEVVAINKETTSVPVNITISHPPALRRATVYDIVDGSAAVVPATGPAPTVSCTCAACTLTYTMPAMSGSTLVLR